MGASSGIPRPGTSLFRSHLFWFLVALAFLVTRRPDQVWSPQLQGEDASVFFHPDLITNPWQYLFSQYMGYLNLLPQLLAAAYSYLPIEWAPTVYDLTGFAVTALIAARIATSRLPPVAAAVGAVAIIAVPTNGYTYGNLCCLHFALGALVAVNLLEPAPASRREASRRAAEVTIAAFSGPEGLVLVPFSAVTLCRWARAGQGRRWLALAGLWAGAAVQAGVLLTNPRPAYASTSLAAVAPGAGPALGLLARYAKLLFGGWFGSPLSMPLAYVVLAAVVLIWTLTLAARGQSQRWPAALTLAAGAAMLLAGRLNGAFWPNPFAFQARHAWLPFIAVAWSFGFLWAGLPGRLRWAPAAACAAVVLSALPHWVGDPLPDLHWHQQVAELRAGRAPIFADPALFGSRCPRPLAHSALLWWAGEGFDSQPHPFAMCLPMAGPVTDETVQHYLARMGLP